MFHYTSWRAVFTVFFQWVLPFFFLFPVAKTLPFVVLSERLQQQFKRTDTVNAHCFGYYNTIGKNWYYYICKATDFYQLDL